MERTSRAALVISGLLLAGASPAWGNQVLREEVTSVAQTVGGVLTSCGIEFQMIYRDFTYRRGAPSAIAGSMHWVPHPTKGMGMSLKIVGRDFNDTFSADRQFKVHNGFVRVGLHIHPVEARFECEDPNAFCGVYGLQRAADIVVLQPGAVSVNFNRWAGGMDVSMPISISRPEAEKFFACFGQLFAPILHGGGSPRN